MIKLPSRVYVPAAIAAAVLFHGHDASAQFFNGGDVLVSESFFAPNTGPAAGITVGSTLPGGGTAVADDSSLNVFLNDGADPSFGIGSQLTIQNFTAGTSLSLDPTKIITSFSSKSEGALSFSTDGTSLVFMGYAPNSTSSSGVGQEDISNANTPNHVDPSNPVTSPNTQRAVAVLNANGTMSVTDVNAYSGNNGRAAILANNVDGTGVNNIYMVGNAGNGSGTEPNNIVNNTGVQMIQQGSSGESTVVGAQQGTAGNKNGYQFGFSVTQTGAAADKSGKDDNFRGETVFNNTLYVTKGSGGNGIDTVYQVGTAGSLPTAGTASSTAINILPGFNQNLAGTKITAANAATANFHPFGLFFANSTTLYVADEGDGTLSDIAGGLDPNAGLEKWSLVNGTWKLDYTLRSGLIGNTYSPNGMIISGQQVHITTDGLRNLAGKVNADGTVSLYATTATLDDAASGFDAGADPNQLVEISDTLADTTAAQASGESFNILETAAAGEVLRGVAVATPVPEATTWGAGIGLMGLVALFGKFFRRKQPTA